MNNIKPKTDAYIAYQMRVMQSTGVIGSLYTDPENPEDFIAGHLLRVSPRQVLLESVTPFGRYDGYFVVRASVIADAVYDPSYSQRLKVMLNLNGEEKRPMELPDESGDMMVHVLEWAREHHRVVTLWTHDEAFNGFVTHTDDLHVDMQILDFMGGDPLPDRFELREIELMSVDSEEERMYEALNAYQARNGHIL